MQLRLIAWRRDGGWVQTDHDCENDVSRGRIECSLTVGRHRPQSSCLSSLVYAIYKTQTLIDFEFNHDEDVGGWVGKL